MPVKAFSLSIVLAGERKGKNSGGISGCERCKNLQAGACAGFKITPGNNVAHANGTEICGKSLYIFAYRLQKCTYLTYFGFVTEQFAFQLTYMVIVNEQFAFSLTYMVVVNEQYISVVKNIVVVNEQFAFPLTNMVVVNEQYISVVKKMVVVNEQYIFVVKNIRFVNRQHKVVCHDRGAKKMPRNASRITGHNIQTRRQFLQALTC